jgi:hypothetical protein
MHKSVLRQVLDKLATRPNQRTNAGLIKFLILDSKILNPESKICPPTPTFAVLSQTAGSAVLTVSKNHPFFGHFVKGKIKDYAR